MKESKGAATLPKGVQWSFEFMAIVYVATAAVFVVSPDWPILMVSKAFARYDWPVVFFPIERFWLSVAIGLPCTRAFVAFSAARSAERARFCIQILQVSLLVPAVLFAAHFVLSKYAPLYAIGCLVELAQLLFYFFLRRRLL